MKYVLLLLLLTGCTSIQSNGRYRSVELAAGPYGSVVTAFEVWDVERGWENGGTILQLQLFSHGSPLNQVANPAAVVAAAAILDVENSNTTTVQAPGSRRK